MPTFLSRRYMRKTDEVGRTERAVGLLLLLLLAGIVTLFVVQVRSDKSYLFNVDEAVYRGLGQAGETATAAARFVSPGDSPQEVDIEADNPFPEPGVERWRAPNKVFRYTPDNLYTKINGRADAYLQFHVVAMTFGTYDTEPRDSVRADLSADTTHIVDVYWYAMGEPRNASGMFRAEAPPDAVKVPVGRDGYQVGGAVFFWKGSSYVQLLPGSLDEDDARAALTIAERISGEIEDERESQWADAALPEEERLGDAVRFIAQDAFSLDFLSDVYAADYEVEGVRVTLFIHRAVDESTARALHDQYVAFFGKYGRVIWSDPDASRRIVAGEVAGTIDAVFMKGRYLGGATGLEDAEVARQSAAAFYDKLDLP